MGRYLAALYGAACYLVMLATLVYLLGFLANYLVPVGIDTAPAGSSWITSLLLDCALLALFGLQHSLMARPRFKAWWTRLVPASIERSTYVLLASVALGLLFLLWRTLPQVVWEAREPWAINAAWTLYGTGIALLLASTFVIDHFDLFGLRQVWLNLLRRPPDSPDFTVAYFYQYVRHPIYLGWLVIFWATPRMTLGHLLFAAAMTAYILVAVRYEERDLVSLHGGDYVTYRRRVPMLFPRPGQRRYSALADRDASVAQASSSSSAGARKL
jgi:protein-S-isoprenylcysteine O-methyltransferase Ste14